MRLSIAALAALALACTAHAKPPREEQPAPRELLNQMGAGVSDEELERAIAAASAHPLGSAENPVRVGGPIGERAYIARLRCADGSPPKIGARGPAGVGAFGSVVGRYPLDCGGAAPGKVDLVFDIYHEEHDEDRAPPGFTILPR
jgi:hypothetical protein